MVAEYFKEVDVLQALTVIYCESSGYAHAINSNTNQTRDVGLFQFNDKTTKWIEDKYDIKINRKNPKENIKWASWLVYNDGWHHWNASKKCWGKYEY